MYGAASRSANCFRAIAKSKFPNVIGLDLRLIAHLADGHPCRPRSVRPEYSTRIVLHALATAKKKIRYRHAFGLEGMFLVQVGYARSLTGRSISRNAARELMIWLLTFPN